MPTTINGIGTHYYGKKNRVVRQGNCHSCGRLVNLESYDTRLWFVVVYVPLIPIGRKRILDYCPACSRHFAADQAKYQTLRQESLDESLDRFHREGTAQSAIAAHGEMLGFHAREEARALRTEALAKVPNDAEMCAVLGSQLEDCGDFEDSQRLFEKAYQLDPALPHAREGLALGKIVDGRLDDARQLLNFLEQPGAGQRFPLGRLEQLAEAYQKAGRHDEALTLAQHIVREIPQAANNRHFRQFVSKSEKATHRAESVLPPRESSWLGVFNPSNDYYSSGQRRFAYFTAAVLIGVVALAGVNEYRRQNRTVHVRNDFGPAAQVTIDGVAVPAGAAAEVSLPEGKHHVVVSGALDEEFDIDVSTGYWTRWLSYPAWVLNVGGAAQVLSETHHYAENPAPSESVYSAGENLVFVPHVDYLFEQAPSQLRVEGKSTEVVKQQLSVTNEPTNDIMQYVFRETSPEAALRYAESRLTIDPSDAGLLELYTAAATQVGAAERAKKFLQQGFEARPVSVPWHRMYQDSHVSVAEKNELIQQYDALLAAEPNNGELLYLRGRITPEHDPEREYYLRSISADPQLNYPWNALGYQACTMGEWKECKDYIQKALDLNADEGVLATQHMARLGLHEEDELIAEHTAKLAALSPQDSFPTVTLLTQTLVAKGDLARAKQEVDDWEAKVQPGDAARTHLQDYRGMLELMAGDLSSVEQRVSAGTAGPELKFIYLLSAGKPGDAAGDAAYAEHVQDPWNALAVGLSFELAGQPDVAKIWRLKAADSLASLDFDEARAAELLRADGPPAPGAFEEISLLPPEKALLIAALAARFPEQHSELAPLAEHFDVQPSGFRPLVRQAIARKP